MARQRDYKAEYARRIALGKERGISRSQAAGKARTKVGEKPVSQLKKEGVIKPPSKPTKTRPAPILSTATKASKSESFKDTALKAYAHRYNVSPAIAKKEAGFKQAYGDAKKIVKQIDGYENTLKKMKDSGKNTSKQEEKIKEARQRGGDIFRELGLKDPDDFTALGMTPGLT